VQGERVVQGKEELHEEGKLYWEVDLHGEGKLLEERELQGEGELQKSELHGEGEVQGERERVLHGGQRGLHWGREVHYR
jgi:hypothetical protein